MFQTGVTDEQPTLPCAGEVFLLRKLLPQVRDVWTKPQLLMERCHFMGPNYEGNVAVAAASQDAWKFMFSATL